MARDSSCIDHESTHQDSRSVQTENLQNVPLGGFGHKVVEALLEHARTHEVAA
jgi:hypothetical protein